jgi:hypothetical protein
MAEMHQRMLWAHLMVVALGVWLITSPFQFGLFDPQIATLTARDVTAERNLWDPALRNALTGWSNIASGLLLMLFGSLSLWQRHSWAQWGTTLVGLWLLFAGLVFWTPSAAAYANDMIVGALAIAFSILIPMMPGMSHEGMMDKHAIPPGWTYSPSSWLQRLPIIALGLFGFLIARYLAAFQLGHVNAVWDPIFHGALARNGTEHIITSPVSKAWPVADAGLGATAYMLEALMGAMGAATRWRTMPWMVTFFFILVVPLGGVSILFILIQPVVIGTYCTLCLIQAFAMLVMIPLALDEVIAMGQYMLRSLKAGQPFLRTFLIGGPDPAARPDDRPGFEAPLRTQIAAATWGVTVPWTLVATSVLGAWLMFTPAGVRHRARHGRQRSYRWRIGDHHLDHRHGRGRPAVALRQRRLRAVARRGAVAVVRRPLGPRDRQQRDRRPRPRGSEPAARPPQRRALRRLGPVRGVIGAALSVVVERNDFKLSFFARPRESGDPETCRAPTGFPLVRERAGRAGQGGG